MIQPLKISGGSIVRDDKIDYFFGRICQVIAYSNYGILKPIIFGWSDCKYISPSSIAIIFEKEKG